MKKVLLIVAVACIAGMSVSCKKECTCTEKQTGVTQKTPTDSQYRTCKDVENLLQNTSSGVSKYVKIEWSCK